MFDKIALHSTLKNNVTCVSNDFIDILMPESGGEFVKTYLYLLRSLNKDCSFSVQKAAEALHHTEADIKHALSYWRDKGLLNIDYDEDNNIRSIYICDANDFHKQDEKSNFSFNVIDNNNCTKNSNLNSVNILGTYQNNKTENLKNVINSDFSKICSIDKSSFKLNDEDLSEIYSFAEAYKRQPLSSNEQQFIMNWSSDLSFSASLIKYLIDVCVNEGHMSFYYMNKVALDWKDKGITTKEEAERQNNIHSKAYYAILKAFGITGRSLNTKEEEFLNKWISSFKFSDELIKEACSRTVLNIGKISFSYADKILSDWNMKNIRSISDVKKHDALSKGVNNSNKNIKVMKKVGNFNNFEQRTNNLTALELERKLLK